MTFDTAMPVSRLAAGVEMKVASERLGHSQISITADLYTHVNESVGRAATEKIAGALKASTKTVPAASLQQTPGNSPQQVATANTSGNEQGPRRRFRWSGAWIVCLNRARPKGFEPPTF